jgi:hypothetical protein
MMMTTTMMKTTAAAAVVNLGFQLLFPHLTKYRNINFKDAAISRFRFNPFSPPQFNGLFFSQAKQPKANQGRLILEVFRSHTMTRHSR